MSTMNKELFGVFGPPAEFNRFRSEDEFDRVISGDIATIGIRDSNLDTHYRSGTYSAESGVCVIWGEVYLPDQVYQTPAQWVLHQFARNGQETLSQLNGSYLVYIEYNDEAMLYTDPIRSWECFYTDAPGTRVFGTDALEVGSTIINGTLSDESMFELAHMSVILGNRTLLKELNRVPFDGYLTITETGTLHRFSYQPQQFDYVSELSERLDRALRRRAQLPGCKGLLLGGGYDSRILLTGIPSINQCFTIGADAAPEIQVARLLSDQYNAAHHTLPINDKYMNIDFRTIRYTNGINESIHIHHRGLENVAGIDTIYHGWGIDALLKDFFIQKQRIGLFGKSVRRSQLSDNPDPATFLMKKRLGIMPSSIQLLSNHESSSIDEPQQHLRERLEQELDRCRERCENEHNVANVFGIKNLPSKSFRMHLADNYLESFLCADRELIEWHLKTPPEYRNTATFLKAIRQLDSEILRHRPPDRPRSIRVLNPIEGFLRRKLPLLSSFGRAWPNPDQLYDRYELDQTWFPDIDFIHSLDARLKLRVHDIVTWLNILCEHAITPEHVLFPVTAPDQVPITNTKDLPSIVSLQEKNGQNQSSDDVDINS